MVSKFLYAPLAILLVLDVVSGLGLGSGNYGIITVGSGNGETFTADITGSLGMITIMAALMGLALVVGLSILGSKISDVSVSFVLKGSGFIAMWSGLSAVAMPLISQIGTLGGVLFFVLTCVFTIGMVDAVGVPSVGGGND